MLLMFHVLVAIGGLVITTIAWLRPKQQMISLCFGLLAATLASGTVLVVKLRAPLLSACLSGLLYTGFILIGISLARRRLASQQS